MKNVIGILMIISVSSSYSFRGYNQNLKELQCQDQRKDCKYLRSLGWCKYQQKAMSKFCPRTCLFCKKNKPNADKMTASKPMQTSKTTSKTMSGKTKYARCIDKYGKTRCQYYKYIGWCEKSRNMKYYCKKTCICDRKIRAPDCRNTKYGCCWDNKTVKTSQSGVECPECKDDVRFLSLCRRFKSDCQGKGGLGKSLRKYCEKTCELCCEA